MSNAKIAFYSMMESMVAAGISLQRILNGPVPRPLRTVCRHIAQELDHGKSLTEAMRMTHAFSETELALIAVGEATASLDASARNLRQMFEQDKAFKSQIASSLIQPALTYIAAGPLLKIIELAQETSGKGGVDFAAWGGPLILRCILWWGAPVALYFAMRFLGSALGASSLLGGIVSALPFFGKLQHRIASASFWRTFGTSVAAGITYSKAIKLAANACRSPYYKHNFLAMAAIMEHRQLSLTEAFDAVATHRDVSAQYPSLIATGDQTGTIDITAEQISQLARQDAATSLKRFAAVFPVLVYTALALYLGYQIISFYAGYIGQLTNL